MAQLLTGLGFEVATVTDADERKLSRSLARFIQDDRHANMPRSEFVARSWRLAIARAKQLGWIG